MWLDYAVAFLTTEQEMKHTASNIKLHIVCAHLKFSAASMQNMCTTVLCSGGIMPPENNLYPQTEYTVCMKH